VLLIGVDVEEEEEEERKREVNGRDTDNRENTERSDILFLVKCWIRVSGFLCDEVSNLCVVAADWKIRIAK
jgi:hypothetical protein